MTKTFYLPFGDHTFLLVARNAFQFINDHIAGEVRIIDTPTAQYLKMIDMMASKTAARHGDAGIPEASASVSSYVG